jgi:hypothetical protein
MVSPSQKKASTLHRSRLASRGLLRVEVQATKSDTRLIRALAEELRSESPRGKSLRSTLESALIESKTKSLLDIFGSDLPDDAFSGVFDQPRQSGWREVEL